MNENGKRLNLFPQKRKKSKVSSNQAFDMMESVADKSSVNLLKIGEIDKSTKGIHNALMAAGMTPGLGNIADLADATLYALEGEFGEAAWSAAAAIPVIGQMVSGKRALKAAKAAGEEMVTLYRGVDKWFPGEMVKSGKFKGGGAHLTGKISGKTQGSKDYIRTSHSKAIGEDIADDAIWLTDLKDVAKKYSKMPPKGFEELYKRKGVKSGFLLEFEVPKSWIKKKGIPLYQSTERYEGNKKTVKEGLKYVFQECIPKEFLKKVHK